MGDQGSDKSSQQNTSVENKQVTQSGKGLVGISGSTLAQSSVTVIDGDVETAKDALALASQQSALSSALVSQTLKSFEGLSQSMNSSVDKAVEFAGQVSMKSTQTPSGDVAADVNKQILTAAIIGGSLIAAVYFVKK